MPSRARHLLPSLALALAVAVTGATDARAERSPYVEKVYQEALNQLRTGDLRRALGQLERCLFMVEGDDDETFRMTLAIAVVHERLGELGHAIEMYREFLRITGRAYPSVDLFWDDRRREVAFTLGKLEELARRRLSLLRVASEPPGAAVLVDGRQAGAHADAVTPVEIFVKPGRHVVEVRAKGRPTEALRVNAQRGAIHELGFGLSGDATAP